jgi:molybdopterin molybdotransferase
VFLIPALRRLSGLPSAPVETRSGLLGRALEANDRRQDYIRATLSRDTEGRAVVTPFPLQDSSMLATLARAEALLVRAPHAPALEAGSPVEFLELSSLGV